MKGQLRCTYLLSLKEALSPDTTYLSVVYSVSVCMMSCGGKRALKWTKQLLFPFKSHTHKTSRSFYIFTKGGNRSNINTKHWLPLDLSLNSSPRFSYTYMRKYLWISIWDSCKIPASLRNFFLFKKQLSDRNNISQASAVFMEHWLTVVAFVYFSWYDITLGYSSALFCFFLLSDPECWWRVDLAAWKIS